MSTPDAYLYRTAEVGGTTETFFTMNHIAISFYLLPYVSEASDSINVSASLKDFEFSFQGPPYAVRLFFFSSGHCVYLLLQTWAADMPSVYVAQLQNQNWTDLSIKANELISTQMLPMIAPVRLHDARYRCVTHLFM
jgi:hypothetical protein